MFRKQQQQQFEPRSRRQQQQQHRAAHRAIHVLQANTSPVVDVSAASSQSSGSVSDSSCGDAESDSSGSSSNSSKNGSNCNLSCLSVSHDGGAACCEPAKPAAVRSVAPSADSSSTVSSTPSSVSSQQQQQQDVVNFAYGDKDRTLYKACLETLVESMKDDPIYAHFIGSGSRCERFARHELKGYMKALPDAANFVCVGGGQAVALWQLLPRETPANEFWAGWQRWLSVPLRSWRRLVALELYYEHMHDDAAQQYGEYYYLSFIATAVSARGKGLGSLLLKHMTAKADSEGRHCLLEATSPASRRLYERHGFVLREEHATGGASDTAAPHVYLMVRPPQQPMAAPAKPFITVSAAAVDTAAPAAANADPETAVIAVVMEVTTTADDADDTGAVAVEKKPADAAIATAASIAAAVLVEVEAEAVPAAAAAVVVAAAAAAAGGKVAAADAEAAEVAITTTRTTLANPILAGKKISQTPITTTDAIVSTVNDHSTVSTVNNHYSTVQGLPITLAGPAGGHHSRAQDTRTKAPPTAGGGAVTDGGRTGGRVAAMSRADEVAIDAWLAALAAKQPLPPLPSGLMLSCSTDDKTDSCWDSDNDSAVSYFLSSSRLSSSSNTDADADVGMAAIDTPVAAAPALILVKAPPHAADAIRMQAAAAVAAPAQWQQQQQQQDADDDDDDDDGGSSTPMRGTPHSIPNLRGGDFTALLTLSRFQVAGADGDDHGGYGGGGGGGPGAYYVSNHHHRVGGRGIAGQLSSISSPLLVTAPAASGGCGRDAAVNASKADTAGCVDATIDAEAFNGGVGAANGADAAKPHANIDLKKPYDDVVLDYLGDWTRFAITRPELARVAADPSSYPWTDEDDKEGDNDGESECMGSSSSGGGEHGSSGGGGGLDVWHSCRVVPA